MKSAYLVSYDPDLFLHVRAVLVEMGAKSSGDGVQLQDEGSRLFTVEGNLNPAVAFDWQVGPFLIEGDFELPDMTAVTPCLIECRWECWFAEIVRHIACKLQSPAWVLDCNGVIWPAAEVDPQRVRL